MTESQATINSQALNSETLALSEEEISQRWRRAILKLSDNLKAAAAHRSDLTPILMDALNYALRQLLEHGNDYYVHELEEWLAYEEIAAGDKSTYPGPERRCGLERRDEADRRRGDRREGRERRQAGNSRQHNEP